MIYVCSDLHGDSTRYQALLERISFQDQDLLYILGDVIDRGPDGVKILQDMMGRFNVIPILGNHELTAAVCLSWLLEEVTERQLAALGETQVAALQEWIYNGGGPTLRALQSLSRTEREEILEYLQNMELYAQVKAEGQTFVLVHAGLEHFSPERRLEDYDLKDFLFCRPCPGQNYYMDRYLIFGHTPTRVIRQAMGQPPEDKILHWGNQIAIDCGCGHGGRLGCLCLNSLEEFYV